MQDKLQWMVFKVKKRSQKNYYDLVSPQVGAGSNATDFQQSRSGYPVDFNWPYDYLSFVELVKIDVDVLLK